MHDLSPLKTNNTVQNHKKQSTLKWLWTSTKTTHPEDNTETDVRKTKNFAVELTKAVKL